MINEVCTWACTGRNAPGRYTLCFIFEASMIVLNTPSCFSGGDGFHRYLHSAGPLSSYCFVCAADFLWLGRLWGLGVLGVSVGPFEGWRACFEQSVQVCGERCSARDSYFAWCDWDRLKASAIYSGYLGIVWKGRNVFRNRQLLGVVLHRA